MSSLARSGALPGVGRPVGCPGDRPTPGARLEEWMPSPDDRDLVDLGHPGLWRQAAARGHEQKISDPHHSSRRADSSPPPLPRPLRCPAPAGPVAARWKRRPGTATPDTTEERRRGQRCSRPDLQGRFGLGVVLGPASCPGSGRGGSWCGIRSLSRSGRSGNCVRGERRRGSGRALVVGAGRGGAALRGGAGAGAGATRVRAGAAGRR